MEGKRTHFGLRSPIKETAKPETHKPLWQTITPESLADFESVRTQDAEMDDLLTSREEALAPGGDIVGRDAIARIEQQMISRWAALPANLRRK